MLRRDYQSDPEPDRKPRFQPGQLVRHKRYNYRGVVVAFDLKCEAADSWYQSNQTQPDRNQSWYHVLVHASSSVAYPAESSLEEETEPREIQHAMISVFFDVFDGRRYLRNDTPWPGAG